MRVGSIRNGINPSADLQPAKPPVIDSSVRRLLRIFLPLGIFGLTSLSRNQWRSSCATSDMARRHGFTDLAIHHPLGPRPKGSDLATAGSRPLVGRAAAWHHRLGVALTAAGTLFPGWGWAGILLVLVFSLALCKRPKFGLVALSATALVANATFAGTPVPPPDWIGINTALGSPDPTSAYQRSRVIQSIAAATSARVIVFPESVFVWTEATDLLLAPLFESLQLEHKSVVIGARILCASTHLENGLIVRGTHRGNYYQRIPVPIGMWRPFDPEAATLLLLRPPTLKLGNQVVAPLICYEQFLALPILSAIAQRPTLIVAVANCWWANDDRIARCQYRLTKSWARLFQLPIVSSFNVSLRQACVNRRRR